MDHVIIEPSVLYFGTPVALLASANDDGSANLAPMSSFWALGDTFVLGLSVRGHTAANLRVRPELTVNLPGPELWSHVDRLALLTGADPVPPAKADRWTHERDKFGAAGLVPQPADLVGPPRVAECPIQLEARASSVCLDDTGEFVIVQARVLRVHAARSVVVPGTSYVDTGAWHALVYCFRHYFAVDNLVGKSVRAEY